MQYRTKGFTLIELLVTLAVVVLLMTLAIPVFTQSIQRSRADAEVGDLRRALTYARLEAIARSTSIHVRPRDDSAAWSGELAVFDAAGERANVLRVVPAISRGAQLTLPSDIHSIDFNPLGGLSTARDAVLLIYVSGEQRRVINVCLNGRVVLDGSCG